jgi:hypothetical protein
MLLLQLLLTLEALLEVWLHVLWVASLAQDLQQVLA